MANELVQITRYPNRRFYARNESSYLPLPAIEEMVRAGKNVEIRDSQSNEDVTRVVLTRIIMDRQPEKMLLFPVDLLHFIVRSNDVMTDFLRDYFRHSLPYLEYLQRHSATARTLLRPVHWVKAWLDGIAPRTLPTNEQADMDDPAALAKRVAELEERIRQLESVKTEDANSSS